MTERGKEVEIPDKASRALPHDDKNPTAAGGNLGCAPAAGETNPRSRIVSDHRAIQIAEPVDLSAAEKTESDPSALQPITEHLGNRHRGQRGLAQFAVADRERKE